MLFWSMKIGWVMSSLASDSPTLHSTQCIAGLEIFICFKDCTNYLEKLLKLPKRSVPIQRIEALPVTLAVDIVEHYSSITPHLLATYVHSFWKDRDEVADYFTLA